MKTGTFIHAFYDIPNNIWERKLSLPALLNMIRVMQNRIRAYPIVEPFLRIKSVGELIPTVEQVVEQNKHFELEEPFKKLLLVSLTNYFLKQLKYPLVIGTDVAQNGLNIDTLSNDLKVSLDTWMA